MTAADDNLRTVLGSLEATFDAALARAEDEAASDLAFSLLQDASLSETVARAGSLEACVTGRAPAPVVAVGHDFVACSPPSTTLFPLARVVLRQAPRKPRADRRDETLLELLRDRARRGAAVEVHAGGLVHKGRLARACRDHLVVVAETGPRDPRHTRGSSEAYIPLGVIDEVRLTEETSRDA